MPAGELIADSQLAATAPVGFGEAVIAFMNPGGVRNPGFTFVGSAAGEGDGNVTYGEAFTVHVPTQLWDLLRLRQDEVGFWKTRWNLARGSRRTLRPISLEALWEQPTSPFLSRLRRSGAGGCRSAARRQRPAGCRNDALGCRARCLARHRPSGGTCS